MKEDKTQIKNAPVNWEAVELLAMNVGAREAARRLELNANTVLSRARREKWKLPKRKGGATIKNASAITMQSKPGDALIAHHQELEVMTKTGLMQAFAKIAKNLSEQDALSVENIAQFKDLILAGVKLFGWEVNQGPTVNVNNQVGVVVTEAKRRELQLKLQRLQEGQAAHEPQPAKAHVVSLPKPQTQSTGNVGAGNAIPSLVPKPPVAIGPWQDLDASDPW